METIKLNSLSSPEAAPYHSLTRAQLKAAGGEGLFIAESVNVIKNALIAGYDPVSFLAGRDKLKMLEEEFGGIEAPVYWDEPEALEALTGYSLSRGVLCAMKRKPLRSAEEVTAGASRIAVLEGIMDPTNIGAIFRSAAALGMDAVLVGSSCCDPLHRRAARVSMGSVFLLPWTVLPCLDDDRKCTDVEKLRSLGFMTAAAALTPEHVLPDDPVLLSAPRLAVLIGSEGDGLMPRTIASCDRAVCIPMAHGVDSLNAAAASAVLFWVLGKR